MSVDDLAERLAVVHARLDAAGVDPASLTIVAVTKGFGVDALRAAAAAGLRDVGENYAPELLAKAAALLGSTGEVRWHFIGRLQRNKVRKLAETVTVWQSVDRIELGEELARRVPGAAVLVQVNASGEATKGGCEPGATASLVGGLRDLDLDVQGLMTVAARDAPAAAARTFASLRRRADELGLRHCSMGMSDDYVAAARAGATILRLGRALFGPRPGPAGMQN